MVLEVSQIVSASGGPSAYPHQVNLECNGFAGQRVVRVQRDLRFGDFSDRHGHLSTAGARGPDPLAYGRGQTAVHSFPFDRDEHAVTMLPEGVLRLNDDRSRFPDSHADHGFLDACNESPSPDRESQGGLPRRGQADGAIFERASVVDPHGIADSRKFQRSPHNLDRQRFRRVTS